MAIATLESVDAVVTALGGSAAVRRLTGQSSQALYNWRRQKSFPATTHALMQRALADAGYVADAALWRQTCVAE